MCDLHNLIGQLQWRDVKIPILKGLTHEIKKCDHFTDSRPATQ